MSLSPGKRLGAYEVVSLLGAGGMGVVYRARDTRLDRTVAIKVLPAVTSTGELRERFEREARAIAALNHPHICTLHDVGRQDDVEFLVMEYLEGETLQDRLRRGALRPSGDNRGCCSSNEPDSRGAQLARRAETTRTDTLRGTTSPLRIV
jgi:serine/threonine protein kinase